MNETTVVWLVAGAAAFVVAIGHVLIKLGVRANVEGRKGSRPWHMFLDVRVMTGYGLMLVVSLVNLWAFRVLPLKAAAALIPLQFVGIAFLSRVVLGERLSRRQLGGGALIVLGVIAFHL